MNFYQKRKTRIGFPPSTFSCRRRSTSPYSLGRGLNWGTGRGGQGKGISADTNKLLEQKNA